jgi:hypothetical protein
MAKQQRVGGSFAPPLTDELLASYQALIEKVPDKTQLKEALVDCMACCRKWWELPESTGGVTTPHLSGRGVMVDLDDNIKADLWDHIPWEEEIATIAKLFDGIDPVADSSLRHAAFHLLWHVKELDLDREPITMDKI